MRFFFPTLRLQNPGICSIYVIYEYRPPGVANDHPLLPGNISCLENSMDKGVWWATVHKVAKNWT